ncbi:hypothetical protein [Nocardia jinanensis]|uniref:Uncharacterized protein n=1 Tax=Nocardia jinanensis TaxID=382504 RepID=A0A917RUH8_9NOCA|nr:hypothetical protein [Nocardia jinanensis]GGL27953.1 hypothetical protein GCM10011588_48470 [Nocardia jinanensis]
MTDPENDSTALETALSNSRSPDGLTRDAAIFELANFIHEDSAVRRLHEMLDEDIVTMQVDASDVLARLGGVKGLFLVLDEIGRRRDDPDADYIANWLYELDAGGDVEILEMIDPVSGELSNNGISATEKVARP